MPLALGRPSAPLALVLLSAAGWTLACAGGKDGEDKPGLFEDHDADDDGFPSAEDCDDENADVNPDAAEKCDPNDVDEDCDGRADSLDDDADGRIATHHDADGDGYGEEADTLLCEVAAGYVTDASDCDDADATINPDAQEVCAGGDEDCDGLVDDADDSVDPGGFVDLWEDQDGDGFGGDATSSACEAGSGQAANGEDCDDRDAATNPDAAEVCGGADEDCDGTVDEDDASDAPTWFHDDDRDGYGDASEDLVACDAPPRYVSDDTDCDDTDAAIHPGADETCDDDDQDCDGDVDEDAIDETTWYADADGDTYGDPSATRSACDAPAGYVSGRTDCDDADSAINPGATERCDASDTDEDCDGAADDFDRSTALAGRSYYYEDADGDGYGDPSTAYYLCDAHSGFVADDTDCDDTAATAYPGAAEVCDSHDVDEDCDGLADDDDTSVSAASLSTWYRDADGDGYGSSSPTTTACDAPSGYAATGTDCADSDSTRSPGRTEVCDAANVDEDCDGLADDADSSTSSSGKTRYYADSDGDGYGVDGSGTLLCDLVAGYLTDHSDCDDADVAVSPAADEVCFDAVDDDCDGETYCAIGLSDADRVLTGDSRYAGELGASVTGMGDVNGDGIEDVLAGGYEESESGMYAGKAYLALGGTGNVDLRTGARATWRGESSSSFLGNAGAGPGDLTGDGVPDAVIGVYGDGDGGSGAGAAFVFSGTSTGATMASTSTAWAQLVGENAGDLAGFSVSAAGDTNADGDDDLLVGAFGADSYAGRAYLLTGISAGVTDLSAATAILTGESASDYAAFSLAGAGDVDGDGYDDFLVGAEYDDDAGTDAGAAYLLLGPVSGTASLATADAKGKGTARDDGVGRAVAGGGDLDGDGYDDVVIASAYAGSHGVAYVVRGPFSGTASLSTADAHIDGSSALFGMSAALDGDLDGDGFADLAVGNSTDSTVYSIGGSVSVFLGPVSGSLSEGDADVFIGASTIGQYVGTSVGFVGSQTGVAGVDDLLVGVPGYHISGTGSGAVYVFSAGGI